MSIAVTEAARTLAPLGVLISNGIMSVVNLIIKITDNLSINHNRAIENLAYSLRLEFPHESNEYVHNMATQMYAESRDA